MFEIMQIHRDMIAFKYKCKGLKLCKCKCFYIMSMQVF